MAAKFEIAGYVTWNSKARHVSGKIIKVHTKDIEYKDNLPREPDEPQYEIKKRQGRPHHDA